MDRGSERDTAPGRGIGDTAAGRIPLAVVVVDRAGLVSHWSTGARRLFGVSREDAVGQPAADLLPVSGALPEDLQDGAMPDAYETYDGPGPDLETSLGGHTGYATAGRARLCPPPQTPDGERLDVLWWAYPLVGPGP
ncbi:PAS domain-containing protein, partial [Streptomyces olivaceoviridis]